MPVSFLLKISEWRILNKTFNKAESCQMLPSDSLQSEKFHAFLIGFIKDLLGSEASTGQLTLTQGTRSESSDHC